ncbi:MAG: hypothetical protein EPO24_07860 [Bacteroidetes bacterium]|nr:MAG: hypothetical protein EPO24_07860 [Bacteroidota bacterium]
MKNAPHTAAMLMSDEWKFPYSREKAAAMGVGGKSAMGMSSKGGSAFGGKPIAGAYSKRKFWVPVGRINNAYGDRNLVCSCPPVEAYEVEKV